MELGRRRFGPRHGLLDLEAFELGMIEIKRAGGLVAGARMRHAKRFRLGPILERRLALPNSVRGIERVVLALRALEQMELDEAWDLLQLRVAIEPDMLERG